MINNVNVFQPFNLANNNKRQAVNKKSVGFDNSTVNNNKNVFLKEYIEKRLAKENISMPQNWQINIVSPEKISQKDTKLLRDVRVETYKARVDDMFKMLEQSKEYTEKRISEMKISDKQKEDLRLLKDKYDNYYKIELKAGDKSYDLRNLSEEDKKELSKKNPQFVEFINKEQGNLNNITKAFSTAEIKKEVLAESGKSSRYGAYALVPVLLVLIGQAIYEKRADAKKIAADTQGYLKEQIAVYKEGNPLSKLTSKKGIQEYIQSMKDGKNNWFRVFAVAFAGSWDDCLGAIKDFFQDKDNFGTKKAMGIMIPSMVMGVLTSIAISPLMDSMISFSKAKAYVSKHAPELKIKSDAKSKALFVLGTTLLGITFSVFCSGSSWASEFLTFLQLKNNKKQLKETNVINSEEDKNSSTVKNFMSYEAYSGKLNGILKADPISGAGFGSIGALTSSNPYINALSTATCGCIETITASIEQFTKDGSRRRDIDKQKEKLLA